VQPSAALLRILRERFEQEVGAARMQAFAQEAGLRLAEAQRWEDALAVLARGAARPPFLAVLGRALRGVPPLAGERALRWVERVTDEEAAADPELAVARAALHEGRGNPGEAARVLRRALGSALVAGDYASSQRLTAEVARLAAASGGSEAGGLGYGLRAAEAQQRRPRVGRLLALTAAVGLTAAAAGVGGAQPQWVFVLLLASAIVLWVSEIFPDFAVSLGLMAAWILWGIARPAQAAAGFASMNWFFVLSVLGIAAAVARSGLLFRVGLLLVHRMRRGLFWQAAALLLTGVVLSPILPQNKGRAALTGPLALAVAEASRLRDREPAAALLGLAAWIGAGPMMFLFLNGSALTLLAWGLLPEASRARFDWIHWLGAAAPLGVFLSIGALAALFLVFRPRQASAPTGERVNVQLAVLGPPSAREWAMIAVLALTVAGWIAAPALRVDAGTVAVLGLFASVAAGCFDRRAFQELDWNYLIFYGVALSIAVLTVSLGLDRVVAGAVGARLTQIGVSPLLFVLGVACLNFLVQLVLSQNQSILLLGLALIPVAPTVGVDPWVVIVTLLATSSMWFLPAQTTSYLVAYSASEGRLYSHTQARRMSVAYAAVTLAGLALSIPYWRLIGLL
jgi:DASS family divalent anion:Na+ symporter